MVSEIFGALLSNGHQVRPDVAVDVGHGRGLRQVAATGWATSPGLTWASQGIQAREGGPDVVAVVAQAFAQGGQCRIQLDGVDLVQYVGQRLEQRVHLGAARRRRHRGAVAQR